jgi:hypothetical protein
LYSERIDKSEISSAPLVNLSFLGHARAVGGIQNDAESTTRVKLKSIVEENYTSLANEVGKALAPIIALTAQ